METSKGSLNYSFRNLGVYLQYQLRGHPHTNLEMLSINLGEILGYFKRFNRFNLKCMIPIMPYIKLSEKQEAILNTSEGVKIHYDSFYDIKSHPHTSQDLKWPYM